MAEPVISHVSDTARWIAAYRAIETRRPDALFSDPWADRLAGPRGYAIVAKAPWVMRGGGVIVARTKLIDDLVLAEVAAGADTVVNLAAGLDTRPYRLALPPALQWIEVDLPGVIAEKEQLMKGEQPVCRLRRDSLDLCAPDALQGLLDRLAYVSRRIVVISEGLLMYLRHDDVAEMSRMLKECLPVESWILNLNSPGAVRQLGRTFGAELGSVELRFAPANGVAYFEEQGWKVREVFPLAQAASRLRRGPFLLRVLMRLVPAGDPRRPHRRWGAVVRLGRE